MNKMRCPVCGGDAARDFTVEDISGNLKPELLFDVCLCKGCRCTFVDPVPGADILAEAYSGNYYSYTSPGPDGGKAAIPLKKWSLSASFLPFFKRNTAALLREEISWTLYPAAPAPQKILDFGCGAGHYTVETARIFPDAEIVGVDEFIGLCAPKRAPRVRYFKSLDECSAAGMKFDFVILRNVLEHLPDPAGTMRAIRNVSTENCLMYAQLPNYDAPDRILFGKTWYGYDVPRHIYCFSARSLGVLAEKTGWKILKKRTHFIPAAWITFLSLSYFCKYRFKTALPRKMWRVLALPLSVYGLLCSIFGAGGTSDVVFAASLRTGAAAGNIKGQNSK